MKVYKLTKPKDFKGLFAESLVEDPAIQSNLMAFDEEKPEFTFAIDEQRIIYAPALIPNKMIFRKDIQGEPAHVYFEAETIKELWIDFNRQGGKQSVNLNHSKQEVEGVFAFESWIVEDKKIDKSFKMGFDVPAGTLMKGYKIDNDAVWQDIKLGNLKGLSIEGQLFPEFVKDNPKNHTVDGKEVYFENEMLQKGTAIKDADGNLFKDGRYELMTNVEIEIENGTVQKITEIQLNHQKMNKRTIIEKFVALFVDEEEEDKKEPTIEPEKEIEAEVEVEAEPKEKEIDPLEQAQAKVLELENKVADLEAQLALAKGEEEVKMSKEKDLEAKIVKLEADIIDALKIKNVPPTTELKYEEMTNAQKVKFNRGKL
jgi:hypothetical protein